MGWFSSSSSTEKPAIERYPHNIDVTSQRGSGAEQDRYDAHFSGPSAEQIKRGFNEGVDRLQNAGEKGYNKLREAGDRGYDKLTDAVKARGEGAEQDRYGKHFEIPADQIERGLNQGKDKLREAGDQGYQKLKQAAQYKGVGAEQDRYANYFSPALHNMDAQLVREVAGSIALKGEKASFQGLGYDGQQRAKLMAGIGGGAEQDRFAAHFGLSRDAVASAAQKLKDGAKDVLERR